MTRQERLQRWRCAEGSPLPGGVKPKEPAHQRPVLPKLCFSAAVPGPRQSHSQQEDGSSGSVCWARAEPPGP